MLGNCFPGILETIFVFVLKGSTRPPILQGHIDVKITSICPFCYQDSYKRGTHADQYLEQFINKAAYEEVMSLALGGGEPTVWRGTGGLLQTI